MDDAEFKRREEVRQRNRVELTRLRKEQQVEVLGKRVEIQDVQRQNNALDRLREAQLKEQEILKREMLLLYAEAELLPARLREEFIDHERREELRLLIKEKELALEEPYKVGEHLRELEVIKQNEGRDKAKILTECISEIVKMYAAKKLGVGQSGDDFLSEDVLNEIEEAVKARVKES